MQKEQLSVVDQAEQYVENVESNYIFGLLHWETQAQHRSEHCSCPQCKKEVKRASRAVQKELERTNPDMPQHYFSHGYTEEDYGGSE